MDSHYKHHSRYLALAMPRYTGKAPSKQAWDTIALLNIEKHHVHYALKRRPHTLAIYSNTIKHTCFNCVVGEVISNRMDGFGEKRSTPINLYYM